MRSGLGQKRESFRIRCGWIRPCKMWSSECGNFHVAGLPLWLSVSSSVLQSFPASITAWIAIVNSQSPNENQTIDSVWCTVRHLTHPIYVSQIIGQVIYHIIRFGTCQLAKHPATTGKLSIRHINSTQYTLHIIYSPICLIHLCNRWYMTAKKLFFFRTYLIW